MECNKCYGEINTGEELICEKCGLVFHGSCLSGNVRDACICTQCEFEPTVHSLKTVQPYFNQVANLSKKFEVRKNDRDFKEGDYLVLEEWSKEYGYSGKQITCVVHMILDDKTYCKRGYIIMSISPLAMKL